jgi:hypothetical protein
MEKASTDVKTVAVTVFLVSGIRSRIKIGVIKKRTARLTVNNLAIAVTGPIL